MVGEQSGSTVSIDLVAGLHSVEIPERIGGIKINPFTEELGIGLAETAATLRFRL